MGRSLRCSIVIRRGRPTCLPNGRAWIDTWVDPYAGRSSFVGTSFVGATLGSPYTNKKINLAPPSIRRGEIILFRNELLYGVNLLMNVDQFANEVRVPTPPSEGAQEPSKLSPVPPAKNGPP